MKPVFETEAAMYVDGEKKKACQAEHDSDEGEEHGHGHGHGHGKPKKPKVAMKPDNFETDNIKNIQYEECVSSASCKIKNIKSILFGGQSSRFWMMRKYINSLSD